MPLALADIGTSECPVMPGEVLISSRNGLRSVLRIMMSARAQPRQSSVRNASTTMRLISCSSLSGKPLGQWYCVTSVKYLFW